MKKIIFLFLIIFSTKMYSQNQTNERAKWFVNDRFGMFIHWGLYSAAEGVWKGEKVRYDNDYAEWIQYRNQIEKHEYLGLSKRFDWNEIDPEEWVLLAKKAGMKYITITAKHHDGFALWNSKSSEYNVYNYNIFKNMNYKFIGGDRDYYFRYEKLINDKDFNYEYKVILGKKILVIKN